LAWVVESTHWLSNIVEATGWVWLPLSVWLTFMAVVTASQAILGDCAIALAGNWLRTRAYPELGHSDGIIRTVLAQGGPVLRFLWFAMGVYFGYVGWSNRHDHGQVLLELLLHRLSHS
jgi:hypothetical protein